MNWTDNAPVYGDMIRVKVKFYHHYGIFVDENTVIQFGLPDNSGTPPDEIQVMTTDIATFANGEFVECASLTKAEKKQHRTPDEIVKIATSRLGERGYNILNNNCEHFANECYFGERRSFLDDVRHKIRHKLNAK
ncbi:MAG: lecithin retinol acyltransferase family protein [Clostridia bacterium]|nr:lecithin retinol acyltransferase family protein [Clostridia bacterium]